MTSGIVPAMYGTLRSVRRASGHLCNKFRRLKSRMRDPKYEWAVPFLLAVALFGLNEVQVVGMYLPLTFHDEFGYLANAAFMAGYDWSAAMWNVPYYGIGFSFWLVPVYLFSPDHQWVYQTALSLNGFFHAAAFLVSVQVLRSMFPNVRFGSLVITGFVVALYPAFQLYEKMALGESLLLLLIWLAAWFLQMVFRLRQQQFDYLVCAGLGLIVGYAYIVHGRAIVLVAATAILLFFMCWRTRVRVLDVVAFLFGLGVVVMTLGLLKANLVSGLYATPAYNQHDLLSLASNRLDAVLTKDGVLRFLVLIAGQFSYLSTSSYGLLPLGLFVAISEIWSSRAKFMQVPNDTGQGGRVGGVYNLTLCYMVLILLGSFAVTALFTSNPSRLDNYFYGRYSEPFAAPLMSIAIVFLISSSIKRFKNTIAYVSSFAVGVFLGVIVWKGIDVIPTRAINWIQVTGWFPYRTSQWGIDFWRVIEETSVAVALVAAITVWSRYAGMLVIAMIFWNASTENLSDQLRRGKLGIQADLSVIRELEADISEANSICFYTGSRGSYGMTKDAIQLMLPRVKVIGFSKWREFSKMNCDVLVNDDRFTAKVPANWTLVGKGGRHVELWMAPGSYDANMDFVQPKPEVRSERNRILLEMPQDADKSVMNVYRFVAQYAQYSMLPGSDVILPDMKVSVKNAGTSVTKPDAKLGVFITHSGESGWLGEYRVNLPYVLQPGQSAVVKVPLRLQSRSGTLLPSGKYVVHVALIDRAGWHWGSKVARVVEFQ